ncbi:MAG: DMT family transporter, partial [Thaumarchaeota archaeon]|nr:DMT family transporter [Nitrososphaerota archaeon]
VVAFQESLRGNRTALVSLGLVTLLAFSNGFADTVFAYVIQSGRVSIAGSINALVPVFVVVFAYLVYKERLSRLQYVGVVAAIVGAALVTLF